MKITIDALIQADLETVWACWNNPADIMRWNAASDDWHTTASTVDLRTGGKFTSRMEAKDGSMGFDFTGVYTKVIEKEQIEYTMEDGRTASVTFAQRDDGVQVTETFDAEGENDPEMQRQGWQAILDNFARYVEAKA
ncbi:MAG: SRPBCC family protein [Caldilineaceae bacterium]|nr:SRPBCC family protein [Caldilineaceae bacterium]